MIRLLVRLGILLVANAVGLLVATWLLEDMSLSAGAFVIDVVLFTVALGLMLPFLAKMLHRRRAAALGGVALIATLVALIITAILSDGLQISGAVTWVSATVIVWATSLLASFLLPYLGLRKFLDERRR